MAYNGTYIKIDNFGGGYAANVGPLIAMNQALDLDNIVVLPNGTGFRTRNGNSQFGPFNGGSANHGLKRLVVSGGTKYLAGIWGTTFQACNLSIGAFTDYTGAVSITTGADNIWSLVPFNDKLIGFGGPRSSPDAPFQWTPTNNLAALGGTPPSAYGAFSVNNRVFAFSTSANPSTIYWSVLGNEADWTSTGSGNAVVGSLNDNTKVNAAAVLSTNYVLLFKDTSMYQMVVSTAPFPIYTFSPTLGCAGKNACIVIEGVCYWINQYGRMNSTDGNTIQNYPPVADDLWNAVQYSRFQYITGFRQKGRDYDWLVWFVSTTGSSQNKAIIWDLLNKCWLQCTTGYAMNCVTSDDIANYYMADGSGHIFQLDFSSTKYSDDSESSPGTITGYWRSGWLNMRTIEQIIQPNEIGVLYKTKASGNITVSYGFNFITDTVSSTLAQTATTTETSAFKYLRTTGRGNFFNFKISQSSSTIDTQVIQVFLRGKQYGQKVFTNS